MHLTHFFLGPVSADVSLKAALSARKSLAQAQLELSTGHVADAEASLGHRIRASTLIRDNINRLIEDISGSNVIKTRINATQSTLKEIRSAGESLLDELMASQSGQVDLQMVRDSSAQRFGEIVGHLNASIQGIALFSGLNVNDKPFSDDLGRAEPVQIILDEFQQEFGFLPSSTESATINSSSMQAFLDTKFSQRFSDAEWNSWTSATKDPMVYRINGKEVIQVGVTSFEPGIRNILMAVTALSSLGLENRNGDASKALINSAINSLGQGLKAIQILEARTGSQAEYLESANERSEAQLKFLSAVLEESEGVDPLEVATRIADLTQKIEASYEIINRMQRLSILDSI